MEQKMIKRHDKINMFIHWFNALCWIFLLITGLGLIKNENLQILGGWWANWLRSVFGSGERLLLFHEAVGVLWAGVFLIYSILGARKYVIPFMKEMMSVSIPRDILWLIKKMIQMTMGYKVLEKLGFEPVIPDQGFYNVGQKLFAVPSVLGGIVITITGLILSLSDVWITNTVMVQWAIFIHFATVMLVFAGLFIHVYMASIAAGERPALISMFTGYVPEEYAEHHHKLWYDEIKNAENRS